MFHSSSRHHFDTMFVILCVIAGASSHSISNSSKTHQNHHKLHTRHRSSFINLLLDDNIVVELVKPSPPQPVEAFGNDLNASDIKQVQSSSSNAAANDGEARDICAQLSSILSGNQIKYCHKHSDILESILPQIIHLTKQECSRITKDLKWNCATIDLFLDRSNALSFTKEAALVRSILNASMMYLIVKTCSENMHQSCGCLSNQEYMEDPSLISKAQENHEAGLNANFGSSATEINISIDHDVALSSHELRRLETGVPLRLTRSMIKSQGCVLNTGFADALTGVFIDADDVRSLNKAYKILNEDSLNIRNGISIDKRAIDSDYKDLSIIKWTKSALNLHNNQIGRRAVREAKTRQCKCHGVSGMCQSRTCWDQLHDFNIITSKLREIYLNNAMSVEVKNIGSYTHPDLYLTRSTLSSKQVYPTAHLDLIDEFDESNRWTKLDRVRPEDLAYLYESPNYCDAQPISGHLGTKGRQCFLRKSSGKTTKVASKMDLENTTSLQLPTDKSIPGTCEYLCCNRGFQSELVLDIVECNCRFRFCCKVECDQCLRQQMLHYCR